MRPRSYPVSRRLLLACAAAWIGCPTRSFAGFFTSFFRHDVQVITVTDATPAGRLRRRPSESDPMYYVAVSAGYHDLGGIIAGDKIPPEAVVNRTLTRILARQGYLPASKLHPPTLLLVWTWGTLYTQRMYLPGWPDSNGVLVNRNQILRFLGGYKVGLVSKHPDDFPDETLAPGLFLQSADARALSDLSDEDLYIAAVAAYDYRAALRKRRQLLWLTKISCPSRGLVMADVIPTMLAIAGPNIGRETAKPVWVRASEKFKPEVKIGNPSVVEYLDHTPVPILTNRKAPGRRRR